MKFKFQCLYLKFWVSSMKKFWKFILEFCKYLYNILDFASCSIKPKIFIWLLTEKICWHLLQTDFFFFTWHFILLLHCLRFIQCLYFVLQKKTRTFSMAQGPVWCSPGIRTQGLVTISPPACAVNKVLLECGHCVCCLFCFQATLRVEKWWQIVYIFELQMLTIWPFTIYWPPI